MRAAQLAGVIVWLWTAGVSAQGGALSIELRAPDSVREGDRTQIVARVRGAGPHPLLLTPRSEGTALEVVRGRLLRAEAEDPSAEVLEFLVPIVARSPGAAVVRVSAAGYACEARCRPVHAEASLVVHVAPALSGSRKQDGRPRASSEHDRAPPERASAGAAEQDDGPGERSSSLSWVRMPGAEACASSAELARAVEERLGRSVFVSAADADLAVEGRAERTDGGWRAVLQVSEADGSLLGERTLESSEASCESLGRLVALTVALMIDPLTAPSEPEREQAPPDPPDPIVIVRTERVEVPVPAEPAPGPRWRVELDAAVAGALGLMPTPALGGVATVIVEPPGFVPLVIESALFPFARAEQASGMHADFLHVHAGLALCPLAIRERGLALHGCVGVDAGAVFVLGGDLALDERERVIGQAHAALRGHWDVIGPLTIRLGAHFLVPFRHEAFTYGGGANALYTPEVIAGMVDLGAGLHFD